MEKYNFDGWATKNDLQCSDGRIIRKDAFKHNDGQKVPLVWNHDHTDPYRVLGHALLENREEGVYAYCSFNETDLAQTAKIYVEHGDIRSLSIYANQLKQQGPNVMHGNIREVSLVLSGANPGASIQNVIMHGEESDEEAVIYHGEIGLNLYHADSDSEDSDEDDETLEEVYKSMNEKQQKFCHYMVAQALEQGADESDEDDDENETVEHSDYEGGNDTMKTNVFDQNDVKKDAVISHADQAEICKLAQSTGVGSFQTALKIYMEENDTLQHGYEEIEQLFPEYKDVKSGAPELIERDQTWVGEVIRKIHKSPISRIRTRQMDARGATLRAKGYQNKVDEKKISGDMKLMQRTTDPQTVYRKDELHRDDIIDITEFDIVNYNYQVMKHNLYEDLALAAMVSDLREDGDPDKISEEHIRPIWKDDELYTIHYDVDLEAAKTALQGTDTNAHFGENYIYAEAIITAALYSREQYKGSGNLEFYCTPHLLNVMLLARDLNGRRIYDSKADLAKALNVSAIHTAEQFEGLVRTTKEGAKKELLGLFVNLSDYQFGSTKGGEITRFEQFDIDYNKQKYLIETRLSGALTKIKSAIALEMPVTEAAG